MEYIIVTARVGRLAEAVNKKLADGWELLGGPFQTGNYILIEGRRTRRRYDVPPRSRRRWSIAREADDVAVPQEADAMIDLLKSVRAPYEVGGKEDAL